jgi:hypothetical protein
MKNSCLIRIENDRFVTIRESYKQICNYNECAAALLNFLENRHNSKLQEIEEKQQHRKNFKADKMDYAIQASDRYLSEFALLHHYGRNSVRDAKELLFSKSFIQILRENGKNDFVILNVKEVNKELLHYRNLSEKGQVETYPKKDNPYPKKDNPLSEKGQVTYPKKDTLNKDSSKDSSNIVQVQKEPFELLEPNLNEFKENFELLELEQERTITPAAPTEIAENEDLIFNVRFSSVAEFKAEFLKKHENLHFIDFAHYFEKAKDWSTKKQITRRDWITCVFGFVENDKREGKMKIKLEQKNPPHEDILILTKKFISAYDNLTNCEFIVFLKNLHTIATLFEKIVIEEKRVILEGDNEKEAAYWKKLNDASEDKKKQYFIKQTEIYA